MHLKLTAIILFSLIFLQKAAADSGNLRGFIYDEESGTPLPFVNVVIPDKNLGVESNTEGFYILRNIPAGEHELFVYFIGFDTIRTKIKIESGKTQNQNFYLVDKGFDLEEIEVLDDRFRLSEEISIGRIDIDVADITRMPAIGGAPDLAQYLQVLPGVTFSGDQGGQLYIRGGSPVQNKVLMDGMTIFNPFHSIGLFSVFDVDAVQDVNVMTGGFGARHGGRISSIVDVSIREGNRRYHKGVISATPFKSKALFEGPLVPRGDDGYSLTYLFSTRGSYLEQSSPLLYSYADTSGTLPYNFLDFFGKVTFDTDGGGRFSLYGFNFSDRVNYPNLTRFSWDSYGLGGRFRAMSGEGSTIIEGNFAFSEYQIEQQEADELPRFSKVNGYEAGVHLTNFLQDHNSIEYGFDVISNETDFEFFNAANRRINQRQFSTELGAYMQFHLIFGDWILDPGLRLHYYASLSDMQLEPRLAAQYNINHRIRINMAGGWYSQNLVSATSDRDVVNWFSGYLSAPNTLPGSFRGETNRSRLQKSRHILAGIEFDLFSHSKFSIEGYYKDFYQLININRNKIFDNSSEFAHHPIHQRSDFIREKGDAYGIDFNLVFDQRPWYFWAVYSLGFVDRYDEFIKYSPHWDRRHNIDLLGAVRFGQKDSWELSARWNFGSGFPFTPTKGFYEHLNFSDGASTNYENQAGELGILYGDLNSSNLPDYHRLDLALKKTFSFSQDRELQVTANVTNIYNQQNIFYFDRVSHARVDQLPFMPSIGLRYAY